jgi:hypothetical protein
MKALYLKILQKYFTPAYDSAMLSAVADELCNVEVVRDREFEVCYTAADGSEKKSSVFAATDIEVYNMFKEQNLSDKLNSIKEKE